jgi:tetratricopeptide (TPR) repeat protein
MANAVIVDAVRTPMGRGKAGGALSDVHPTDLMAAVLAALVQRNKLPFAAGLLVIVGLGMSAFISVRAYLDEAEAHERAEQMHRQSQESAKVAFQQSERADDALEFLQDVLKEAGGRIRAGENAAALRAGLQRGEGRLAELKDQPELELLLANELAAAYEAMGDDRQATVLRERAHALLVKLRGAEHEETLRALTAVARSYHQTGRQKAAVPIYELLSAACKSKGTGGQKEWVDTTRRLAGALGVLGQNDKAMALLRSLFDEDDDALGASKPVPVSSRRYSRMAIDDDE